MTRKEAPVVNTGGEMGQILDHLLCAKDPKVRQQDARDALKLHWKLRTRFTATRKENEKLRAALRGFLHDPERSSLGASHPHLAGYIYLPPHVWGAARTVLGEEREKEP